MSEVFETRTELDWPRAVGLWTIARDLSDIAESVLGDLWSKSSVNFTGYSTTDVSLRAPDLTTLSERFANYGGELGWIGLYVYVFRDGHKYAVDGLVSTRPSGATYAWIEVQSSSRAETETMAFAVARMLRAYQRRARWRNSSAIERPMVSRSQLDGAAPKPARGLIKARGVRYGLRRWFIRNRDEIIVSMAVGLLFLAVGWLQQSLR